ncbi:MAG TPA: phosphoribosylaminoimidazolecarboxamide formyltransferase [Firmicutes bacterium]|nr:phosphoribosylaminoimidazolecarboxamide formyltransferase [Bacillota bacterium]
MQEYNLKYGCNPHQKPARIYLDGGGLPVKILNGNPGYINLLDAFNSWQLVKDLRQALGLPAAASFKHLSPAGAAVGLPLNDILKRVYFVEGMELSPLACAYARARGADRMSSFGDWVSFSDTVDESAAAILKKEVSDGVIAPGYTEKALNILKTKKKGGYNIIEIDKDFEPDDTEMRSVFGISFEQVRNKTVPGEKDLMQIVTNNKFIPKEAKRDLIISMITLKYTQSNSVCYVYDGQVIGNGAGQQSRIHCTRLAGDKADTWHLRQHPAVLGLKFKDGLGRPQRDNAIDLFLRDDITENEEKAWEQLFAEVPLRLTREEKNGWRRGLKNVSLGSDGFFPFRDNIDRAYQSGVRFVAQPGGSLRDEDVLKACNEYGIAMAYTNIRLFHH